MKRTVNVLSNLNWGTRTCAASDALVDRIGTADQAQGETRRNGHHYKLEDERQRQRDPPEQRAWHHRLNRTSITSPSRTR